MDSKTRNKLIKSAIRAASYSKDPWRKVGIASVDTDGLVKSAYNCLKSSSEDEFLKMGREARRDFVIHAEQALVPTMGYFSYVVCTLLPCKACMRLLALRNPKEVLYILEKDHDEKAKVVGAYYGIKLAQVTEEQLMEALETDKNYKDAMKTIGEKK